MPAEGLPTLTTPYGANMPQLDREQLFKELSSLNSSNTLNAGCDRRRAV